MHAEEVINNQEKAASDNYDKLLEAKYNIGANTKVGKWAGRKKEYHKEYYKKYNQRPDIKAREKERRSTPEWRAANKEYLNRPEVKERLRESGKKSRQKQTAKDKHRARGQRPDVVAQAKARNIKKKYGITKNEYDSMFTSQGNSCASCGTKSLGTRGPHVDHDHETGAVRGILCSRCNSAAGLLGDELSKVMKLYLYLSNYRSGK